MNDHHLILGQLTDYLTGDVMPDTHDERYRQSLARLLAENKGYLKSEILPRRKLTVAAGDKRALIQIDLTVVLNGRLSLILRYGPGSLVTRHRPSIAASRIMAPYQIPLVVVTNGRDADILDGHTGKVLSSGLASIPDRSVLIDHLKSVSMIPIPADNVAREQRILYAYEVDDACPCDDSVCRI